MKLQKKMSTVVLALLLALLCAGMSASAAAATPADTDLWLDSVLYSAEDSVEYENGGA